MNDFNNLNVWLRERLNESGLSVEAIAREAGLTRTSLYSWMCDRSRPSQDNLLRVCRVLADRDENKTQKLLLEGLKQYTPKKTGRPHAARP